MSSASRDARQRNLQSRAAVTARAGRTPNMFRNPTTSPAPPHTHKYSKREKERERATIAHQRSALRVSQISRLTAQSGPCSRWLVALSTRDAAGSRAGGVPVTTGYIARPPRPPLAAEQARPDALTIPALCGGAREPCAVRRSRNSSSQCARDVERRTGGERETEREYRIGAPLEHRISETRE
jgi:hypothetical protein